MKKPPLGRLFVLCDRNLLSGEYHSLYIVCGDVTETLVKLLEFHSDFCSIPIDDPA